MAFLAAAIPYLSAIGTAVGAVGKIQAGQAAKEAGKDQQAELHRQAIQEVAAAQIKMLDERRKKEMVISRAQALAAFGGGSVSDPSIQNLIADIDNEGSYREAVALYNGEERARKLESQGAMARKAGKQRAQASNISAISDVMTSEGFASGVSQGLSLYEKYRIRKGSSYSDYSGGIPYGKNEWS